MFNLKSTFVVTLMALASSPIAFGDVILEPPGLAAGDQYRLAFATSGLRDALSSNIADYNSFVTDQANLNPTLTSLGTIWRAIGSTASIDARDNTGTNPLVEAGVPIYRLDGILLANNNSDLWDGTIQATFSVDQTGTSLGLEGVFAGTELDGTASTFAKLGDLSVSSGLEHYTDDAWLTGLSASVFGVQTARIYAISGVITAVPEANSLMLLGLGTGVLSCLGCRRVLI